MFSKEVSLQNLTVFLRAAEPGARWTRCESILLEGSTQLTVMEKLNREDADLLVPPANSHGNLNNTLPVFLLTAVTHLHFLPQRPRPEVKFIMFHTQF